MKRIYSILIALVASIFFVACSNETGTVDVIPYPLEVKVSNKTISLETIGEIKTASGLENLVTKLEESLLAEGYNLDGKAIIELRFDSNFPAEAYELVTKKGKITISGGDEAGIFYGIQTVLQQDRAGGVKLGRIYDEPRYAWRGYMLDEARHFSGKERVKELLDLMSYYKLNKFHWHLTDGQGWRIEIKSWPKLALVGGEGAHSNPYDPVTYYTQEEIKELVAYATERYIEIIPEIDMPGHATAANRAYPEYNGGGAGQFPDFTFNVGKEGTYAYLTDILREVAELFPSDYIHIGGDEVFYGSEAWKKDKHVQAMMKREGLETIKDAEGYFINRMTDTVAFLGKNTLGWDDMLDFELDTEKNTIMWWRHDRPHTLRKALELGYNTILCPRKPLYFDFVQHDSHTVGRIWDGFCPLEDVYAFPDAWYEHWEITEDAMATVLGIQANSWTELMHNKDRVDFMTFPRLCALAESAWSAPEVKDYESFTARMEHSYRLFDKLNIYYFDPRNPERHPEPEGPVIISRPVQPMDYRD